MGAEIQVIIFDFDGTIIDSFRAVYQTFKVYFNALGKPFMGEDDFKEKFTSDWKAFIKQYGGNPEVKLEGTEISRAIYESMIEESVFIPGIRESFEKLKGRRYRLVVVSTSIKKVIERKLKEGGIEADLIISGYDLETTDKGVLLEYALKKLRAKPSSCIYIGDKKEDVLAGKMLGMKTVALITGFHTRSELEELGPQVVLKDGKGLIEIVSQIANSRG